MAFCDFNSKGEFNAQAEVMNSNGQAVDNWFSEADESVQSSMIDGSMYSPCDALTVEGVGIDESLGTEHVVVTYEIQLEKPIR